jgi:predicted secreted protein
MKTRTAAAWLLAFATFSVSAFAQDADPAALVKAAQATVQQIDEGRASAVWDAMSAAVKQRVSRKDFVDATTRSRQAMGTPGARYWVTVSRQQAQGTASIPAGMYSSVEFESLVASGKTVRELISFRFDEDKIWRASGYTLRADDAR